MYVQYRERAIFGPWKSSELKILGRVIRSFSQYQPGEHKMFIIKMRERKSTLLRAVCSLTKRLLQISLNTALPLRPGPSFLELQDRMCSVVVYKSKEPPFLGTEATN